MCHTLISQNAKFLQEAPTRDAKKGGKGKGRKKGVKEEDVLRYYRKPGDHFFEAEMGIDDAEWIQDAVHFLEKHWLE